MEAGEATAAQQGTGAETLAAMILTAVERHDGAALRWHGDGEWTDLSYADLGKAVREIAGGLIALGIEPGERVGIIGDTRPEWTLADLGAVCAGATVVPIYHTSSAEEARHVLEDSGTKLVFCEDADQLAKIREASDGLEVEHYVLFEGDGRGAIDLDELRKRGRDHVDEVDSRASDVSPDDVFTLVYTSGTTGKPKGCVLTHANYRSNASALEEIAPFDDDSVVFAFLPLAHVLTRMAQMVGIDIGVTLAYWRRDKDKLIDDLRETRPTHFPAVPRIFEKIYEQAQESAGGLKGKLLDQAIEVGREVRLLEREGKRVGPVLRGEYELADRQVLSKVRDLFGGNIRFALTGAAPVAKEMLEFFDACGVLILEGYGATETSAVATVNAEDDFRFGTVGRALPGTEVRIADDRDDDGRGEILVRGPHVFQGYHGMEEETREVLDDDGWFHTGDLGTMDDDGFLTVTGRTKELIVTSSGKNITPTNIEKKIEESPDVAQAVVFGDDRPYLVALVALDGDAGEGDGARERVQKAIDEANADLAKIEQVKKFAILDRQLSQDEGELTPTLKLKREVVYDHFEDEIDSLYEEKGDGDG